MCPALFFARQQITDAGLAPALAAMPDLEWLSLYGITGVGDASMDALARAQAGRPRLLALDVTGCVLMTRRAPADLVPVFPRVHNFHVSTTAHQTPSLCMYGLV